MTVSRIKSIINNELLCVACPDHQTKEEFYAEQVLKRILVKINELESEEKNSHVAEPFRQTINNFTGKES